MAKRKQKGRKRKGTLSEAASRKAWSKQPNVLRLMHPEDEDPSHFEPSLFQHTMKGSTGWRCLECKYGFHGEWKSRSSAHEACPRCGSERTHQQNCLYRCLNCETEYWEFPGGPLRTEQDDPSCPNSKCKLTNGPKHKGNPGERGMYVEWVNYEEWTASCGSRIESLSDQLSETTADL